jgi:hypothetical protein
LAFHFSLSLTPNCRNWSPTIQFLFYVELLVYVGIISLHWNFMIIRVLARY